MNKNQLKLLLSQGEGYNLEFKENYSENFGREICAFANATGGKIIIGINDRGQKTGFKISNRIKSEIQDIARKSDPFNKIDIENIDIERMRLTMRNSGLKEPIFEYGTFFTVILKRPIWEKDFTQKSVQKSVQKILAIIEKNRYITRAELAHQIGLSESGVKKQMKNLQVKGILKRIGPDKGGYWEIFLNNL